ncbi:MAG: hypothetical protein M9910_04720 [Kiritimatiellae bacterium]|nr:hypothetical protein [Kiritimatiellia bacterium]
MQEAFDSLQVLESHWNRLAAEMDSLKHTWRDKAAITFDRDHWTEIRVLMLASLPDIRESLTQIQRLAVDVGAGMD